MRALFRAPTGSYLRAEGHDLLQEASTTTPTVLGAIPRREDLLDAAHRLLAPVADHAASLSKRELVALRM